MSSHSDNDYSNQPMSVIDWVNHSTQLVNQSATFHGDECNGSFVDMTSLHQQFLNLKLIQEDLQKSSANAQWLKKVSNWPSTLPPPTEELKNKFFLSKAKDASPIDYISWLRSFHQLGSIPRHLKYKDEQYEVYISSLLSYLLDFISRTYPLDPSPLPALQAEFSEIWENSRSTHSQVGRYLLAILRCFPSSQTRFF